MDIRYRVIRENLSQEDIGDYVSFGLEACRIEGGREISMLKISDISTDSTLVCELAKRCNRLGVPLDQIGDIVQDTISYAVSFTMF